jgi:hypothetical protein
MAARIAGQPQPAGETAPIPEMKTWLMLPISEKSGWR